MRTRMKDIAYNKIHQMILSGELSPNEIINESNLAKLLEISRTPVREALQRLESEGYIKTYPNRGSVVNKMDLDDIIKISEMRQALECFAARMACKKLDKNILLKLKAQLEAIPDLDSEEREEEAYLLGRKLHNEILKSTNNELIIKEVDNVAAQMNRLMQLCRTVENRKYVTYEQHLKLIEDILQGDSDQAEHSMRTHLITVTNDVLNQKKIDYI